jgi:hypothetical protein
MVGIRPVISDQSSAFLHLLAAFCGPEKMRKNFKTVLDAGMAAGAYSGSRRRW